jgi:hypothetical protein
MFSIADTPLNRATPTTIGGGVIGSVTPMTKVRHTFADSITDLSLAEAALRRIRGVG